MDPALHELLTTQNLKLEGRNFKGLTVEVWESLKASCLVLKVYKGEKLLLNHTNHLPKHIGEGTYLQKVEDCIESYILSTHLLKSKAEKQDGEFSMIHNILDPRR